MTNFRIEFCGRLKGALGVDYYIVAEREALDKDVAILALYDMYEHVYVRRILPVEEFKAEVARMKSFFINLETNGSLP